MVSVREGKEHISAEGIIPETEILPETLEVTLPETLETMLSETVEILEMMLPEKDHLLSSP